jgi:hypothetical protein
MDDIVIQWSAESVAHDQIRAAVAKVVKLFGFQARILYSDPKYVAARDATEIAWRALPQPEKMEL